MEVLNTWEALFERALIEEINSTGTFMSAKAGDVIIDYGKNIRQIPIITEGSIKVLREDDEGHELLLYYVTANESCAMTFTCCMEQTVSEIKAVAEEDVELIAVPVTVMDEWLIKYPSWKNFVMRTIKVRFNEMLHTIDQIAFQKLDERLISYLKEKSIATNSTLLNLSHQEIASELASSRVVISRLLKKLENDKKLLLYRNQIKLLNDM